MLIALNTLRFRLNLTRENEMKKIFIKLFGTSAIFFLLHFGYESFFISAVASLHILRNNNLLIMYSLEMA